MNATMKAAWYESRGPAREVLRLGAMPIPEPGPGQVRVKVAMSAVNPSDTKGRGVFLGASAMQYPRIIPHQDGAGTIEAIGAGVPAARVGERVWLYMSQRGSAFGTPRGRVRRDACPACGAAARQRELRRWRMPRDSRDDRALRALRRWSDRR